jgi:hypothetical protein
MQTADGRFGADGVQRMNVAILIGALIGCVVILLAIRARLLSKRKGRPLPVPASTTDGNATEGAVPGATATEVPIRGAPIESGMMSRQIAECVAEPGADTANSAVKIQSTKISDPAEFASPATGIGAELATSELDLASHRGPEACAAVDGPVLVQASPVPAIHAPEQEPQLFSQSEAEFPARSASEISATKSRPTAPPASVFPTVALESNEPDSALQVDSVAAGDAGNAVDPLDGVLNQPSGLGLPVESAELPQMSAHAAAIALEPQSIFVPPAGKAASAPAEERLNTPALYRPPTLASAKPRNRGTAKSSPSARVLQSSLDVKLQLLVSRTGDFHPALLFRRPEVFPASLIVKVRGKDVQLRAYGDGWYMADVPSQISLADTLKEGLIASERVSGSARTSWMLSAGREIYVAAPQPGSAGYHSVPRLMLGCAQIVVVRDHLQGQAKEILAETCGKAVQRLGADRALLPGWAVFGPVTPLKSVVHREGEDCLNVIRPLPELAILLEGGLCLRGAEWLEGFPPQITLAGPIPEGERVLIDDVAASADLSGAYKTPGCDSAGEHTVWCAGLSRTYRISVAPQLWESWSAHAQQKGIVCGAISDYLAIAPGAQMITTPSSNRILVGAEPGQLYVCSGQAEEWTGIVPFAPVWGLPANPFLCQKNVARVMLLCARPFTVPSAGGPRPHSIRAWCGAILDCQRKGLELQSPGAAPLWAQYTRAARSIWRSIR